MVRSEKGKMIGRLAFVGPSEGERFYLRVLLANVEAPESFEDLKTVNGVRCATFQDACIRRGLTERCEMVECCLNEAANFQMPAAFRSLFVTLLIFCRPPNPKTLWDTYFPMLAEDFARDFQERPEYVRALAAERIEALLESMGMTLDEFDLQELRSLQPENFRITRDIRDAVNAPFPEEYKTARKHLNVKQREAYKQIMKHVKEGKSGAFFVDGPGGTGKTFLYCALYGKIRLLKKIVLCVASSGIAAAGLPNGRTAHSRFKLPIDIDGSLACDVPKQGSLAALLKETTVIIWDEAPMANKANIHSLDILLRDLCDPDVLFGGKIVVFGGDFRQVLPVVPHKTQREAVEASLVSSPLWPLFTKFHLQENMRAREDPQFASFLLNLGDGKLQATEQAQVTLPSTIRQLTVAPDADIDSLVTAFFPEQSGPFSDASQFSDKAILSPRNDEVDALNAKFLEKFAGESVTYKSFDTLLDDNCNIYPTEFLNTLCPGGMSPHNLVLKKECPVMLLRNTGPSEGRCNGTRLICKEFHPNVILCEFATGFYKGQPTIVSRANLRPPVSANYPFKFQRKQFPIKLSFAMTINKSQGQTLTQVGLYLRQPCFSHGQLYVALSRARNAAQVTVVVPEEPERQENSCIRNIISFDVLARAGII